MEVVQLLITETGKIETIIDTPAHQGSREQAKSNEDWYTVEGEEEEMTEKDGCSSATLIHIHEVNVQIESQIESQPDKTKQTTEPKASDLENKEAKSQSKVNTERLIAELCLRCSDEQMKRNIQLYEYGKGTEHIRKKLGGVVNEQLGKLLVFLYNGKVSRKIPTLKKDLVHDIIDRIQNLLPDICSICNKEYKLDLDDEPIMPCAHCNQSSHKECVLKLINTKTSMGPVDHPTDEHINALINPFNIPGVHYLCKACDQKLLPNIVKASPSPSTVTLEDQTENIPSEPATTKNRNSGETK